MRAGMSPPLQTLLAEQRDLSVLLALVQRADDGEDLAAVQPAQRRAIHDAWAIADDDAEQRLAELKAGRDDLRARERLDRGAGWYDGRPRLGLLAGHGLVPSARPD